MMFYSYILKSKKDGTYYYGSTANLLDRIKTHNTGKVKFTKGHKPYKLHYFETFNSRKEATTRERFYKSIDGYKWLKSKGII
jgi:putative endonuclease